MLRAILLVILFTLTSYSQSKIYLGHVEGEIDLGLAPYIKRVIEEAENNSADAVVFRINTFGGRVDAATQIKDAILNSKIMTVAFIDKRAISAGAMISLSCRKIIMTPGSSIGATTVVDQSGKKQSEKYQSYMRSEMRSTAERNGRRKDIAEGMVDERVVVEGLVDSTKLITLTVKEAVHYGIADTISDSFEDALAYLNLSGAEVIDVRSNWAEGALRFINNPVVSSLLMMIGLVGLFAEVKTPGWGLPGTAAVVALTIFFGAGYLVDLVSVIDVVIFIIGVILLLLEIFVVPGFGILGVVGIIMMIGGLFLGLISDLPVFDFSFISGALIQLASALVLSGIVIFILARTLTKTTLWNRLILNAGIDISSGYSSKSGVNELLGKRGKALTDLRPSGAAMIEDKRIDVITKGEYLEAGARIVVEDVEGSKVVVKKV